jgi:protein-disulfide isomerase
MRQSKQYLEDDMAKKTASKKNAKQQKGNDPFIIAIICIFAVVIVGLIVISKLPKKTVAQPTSSITVVAGSTYTNTSGLSMGNPDAKVKVVEFADFQCPYCQYYEQKIEPTIISQYVDTGKIYYTISPMAFVGQESIDGALAAYCANDQNKFWEYRSIMFANLSGENVGSYTQGNLVAFAKSLGLDVTTFNSCLTSAKHQSDIDAAAAYASNNGINSTPSFLVNGKKVDGMDQLQAAIDAALAE